MHKIKPLFSIALFALFLSSCASLNGTSLEYLGPAPEDAVIHTDYSKIYNESRIDDGQNDPFEGFNRVIFSVNQFLDKLIFKPIAEGYRFVTSKGFRDAVHNVISNIAEPLNTIDSLLAGNFENALHSLNRFIVNTTVGIGGIGDVAEDFGIKTEKYDFGRTMSDYEVPEGPYIVLPLVGGYNLRDAMGLGVDYLIDPVSIGLNNMDEDSKVFLMEYPVILVDTRERYLMLLDDLEKNSLDFYATMRDTYRQNRRNKVGVFEQQVNPYDFEIEDFDE